MEERVRAEANGVHALALLRGERRVGEEAGKADDAVKRSVQLVTHHG